MIREIKFRAKVADSDYENEKQSKMIGSFVHFTGFIDLENDIGYVEQFEKINGVGWIDVDLKTLGQYTGLKDKKGKEIYEGDLLKHPLGVIAEINYADEFAAFLAGYFIGKSYRRDLLDPLYISLCEVIGNKYDNPELLGATA